MDEQIKNEEKEIIPVNLMIISGDQNTSTEHRISYSQLVFLKPEQWPTFTMRFNDLITTLGQMAEDNSKENNDGREG